MLFPCIKNVYFAKNWTKRHLQDDGCGEKSIILSEPVLLQVNCWYQQEESNLKRERESRESRGAGGRRAAGGRGACLTVKNAR